MNKRKINQKKFKDNIIALNELPIYNKFIEPFINNHSPKKKNKRETLREFDIEKWGSLLRYFSKKDKNFSIHDVNDYFFSKENKLFPLWNGKNFILQNEKEIIKIQNNIYYKVLTKYLKNINSLVELGAGYGSHFFKLAEKKKIKKLKLIAGELTKSGVELMRILKKKMRIDAEIGYCDIYRGTTKELKIPKHSLIYTSYAMFYKRKLDAKFVNFFLSLKPSYVIHFEPIYEHMDKNTFYHVLCRKYMKDNDYNVNLLSVLRECEKKDKIKIVHEDRMCFGGNPFLPFSVIIWKKK